MSWEVRDMKLSTQDFEGFGGKDRGTAQPLAAKPPYGCGVPLAGKGNRQGSLSPNEIKAGPEGRDMKLSTLLSEGDKKGWFSLTLFKKNWARFWPLAAGYGLIQFFLLPMDMVTQAGYAISRNSELSQRFANELISAAMWAGPMGLVFGCLTAMALFFYLMNSSSVGMLHALPIRREGLFFTNWLTGLSFFLVPNAAMALIALAVEGFFGGLQPGLTLRWFALHTVIAMFFFCFGVCCAMFTGHILALPVFYGVLNGLVAGLSMLVDNAMDVLLVGYAGNDLFGSPLTRWCTPLWHLMWKIQAVNEVDGVYYTAAGTSIALGYCLVLGAAFTLIAVVVYQHRQLERAGDVVTVGWVRPVFQWGVGLCAGLTIGTVLYEQFFRRQGAWAFVTAVTLCAVLGAFVGRMFLKKSLRVFAEGWKSCVSVGLCVLLLLGGAKADLFGYQRWVPDPAEVESVYLGNMGSAPYDSGRGGVDLDDPALIAEVTALHTELVKDLDTLEQTRWGGAVYSTTPEGWETATGGGLRIEYRMKNSAYESRWYAGIPITQEDLADPDSYAARFQALLNRPEVLRKIYLDWTEDREPSVASGWLSNVKTRENSGSTDLTEEQAEALWKAFLEDLDAGRIHRYLLDGAERAENCYYTDVVFILNLTSRRSTGERDIYTNQMTVTLQRSATSMMGVLEKEGLTELLLSRDTEKFPDTAEAHPG